MNKVLTAEEVLRKNVRYHKYFHPDTLGEILVAMEAYKNQSSVRDEEDLVAGDNNNIKVPCDAPVDSSNTIEQ